MNAKTWLSLLPRRRTLKVLTNVTDEPVFARGPDVYGRYVVAVDQIIRCQGFFCA